MDPGSSRQPRSCTGTAIAPRRYNPHCTQFPSVVQVREEKKLRHSRATDRNLDHSGKPESTFSGYNVTRFSTCTPTTPHKRAPPPCTGKNVVPPLVMAARRASIINQKRTILGIGTAEGRSALSQWAGHVQPLSTPPGAPANQGSGRSRLVRAESSESVKGDLDAGARWQHGHYYSSAVPNLEGVYISETESSARDDSSTASCGDFWPHRQAREGRNLSGSECDRLQNTLDSRNSHGINNTTTFSTFSSGLVSLAHRAQDCMAPVGGEEKRTSSRDIMSEAGFV